MKFSSYFKSIGVLRVLACICVLLYHLNILKGGYLAVCIFFVLTGYFSCVSAFKKEKFSIKDYYLKRFKSIYLPLVVVVFISIAFVSLFHSINWFNLKPETISVLLGFNNYWQLNANLDYFARHVSSPFMHLWYMAIILQFELIFPFLFILLRKLGDKVHKALPCLVTALLTIVATIFFYISSLNNNMMVTYYNTFTRCFSLLLGVFIGFVSFYYKDKQFVIFKNNLISKLIYIFYLLVALLLCVFIESTSKYFAVAMIGISVITARLISYATICENEKLTVFDKVIKYLSAITYEVYLVQYPVIFLLQRTNFNEVLKIVISIVLTIFISVFLKYVFKLIKGDLETRKTKVFHVALYLFIVGLSVYGAYWFWIAKDYTDEMKMLETKLADNSKIMEEHKKEYMTRLKKEQENWDNILSNLDAEEDDLKKVVSNLSVVEIGDSVMLGALNDLYKTFPNGYFDAAISRTAYVANGIIQDLSAANLLGEVVVMNLGTNGDCREQTKQMIMKSLENRKVFWVNVTNDESVKVNDKLKKFAANYDNLYVIDWNSISHGHSEYFFTDGIHLTQKGREVYTQTIYDAIYNVYLDELKEKREEILEEREVLKKQRISFIGNSFLTNAYEVLDKEYASADFITDNNFNYKDLENVIKEKIADDTLSYNVVLMFDETSGLSTNDYKKIIALCKNYRIFIVSNNSNLEKLKSDNVSIIKIYNDVKNGDYLMADGVHLNNEGNQKLVSLIKQYLQF